MIPSAEVEPLLPCTQAMQLMLRGASSLLAAYTFLFTGTVRGVAAVSVALLAVGYNVYQVRTV